jgi:hypothetical protein
MREKVLTASEEGLLAYEFSPEFITEPESGGSWPSVGLRAITTWQHEWTTGTRTWTTATAFTDLPPLTKHFALPVTGIASRSCASNIFASFAPATISFSRYRVLLSISRPHR